MPHTKTRKTTDNAHRRQTEARRTDTKHKAQKETVATMLHNLDMLITLAENANMGMAARIFYTAKEELVHWAVTMNFHESAQDRFINQHLYDNRLSIMESLVMRAINDVKTRGDIVDLLGLPAPKKS